MHIRLIKTLHYVILSKKQHNCWTDQLWKISILWTHSENCKLCDYSCCFVEKAIGDCEVDMVGFKMFYSSNPTEVVLYSSSSFYWNFPYSSHYFEVLLCVSWFTALQGRTRSFYLLVISASLLVRLYLQKNFVHVWVAIVFLSCSGPTLKRLAWISTPRLIIWSEASNLLHIHSWDPRKLFGLVFNKEIYSPRSVGRMPTHAHG